MVANAHAVFAKPCGSTSEIVSRTCQDSDENKGKSWTMSDAYAHNVLVKSCPENNVMIALAAAAIACNNGGLGIPSADNDHTMFERF